MKYVEITFNESELSIDGQTNPAGEYHIREYEHGEWTGGCYATKTNLTTKLDEFFLPEEE